MVNQSGYFLFYQNFIAFIAIIYYILAWVTGVAWDEQWRNTGVADTDTHVTLRVGSTVLSSR